MSVTAEDLEQWVALQPAALAKGAKPTPEQIAERKELKSREAGFLKAVAARLSIKEPAAKKLLVKGAKDAENAAKAAQKTATTKKKSADDEEELDPTKYRENRLKEAAALQAAGIEPLPHKFAEGLGPTWMTIREYRAKFGTESATKAGERLDTTVALSGRIISKRRMGAICFLDLQGTRTCCPPVPCRMHTDVSGPRTGDGVVLDPETNQPVCPLVQVQASKAELTDKPCDFMWCVDKLKRGDIIGLSGSPGRSKKGELSIFPTKMQVRPPTVSGSWYKI